MNNDCLIEIFSYLNIDDFSNLQTFQNALFDEAIHYALQKHSVSIELNNLKEPKSLNKQMEKLEELLKKFGNKLKNIKIRAYIEGVYHSYFYTELGRMLIKYCSNGNIKCCTLDSHPFPASFYQKNEVFFKSIEQLTLDNCVREVDLVFIIQFAIKYLKRFEIISKSFPCNFEFFGSLAASELELFHVPFKNLTFMNNNLTSMSINSTLKHLNLGCISFNPLMLRHFPNIQTLTIQASQYYSLEPILFLSKLEKLSLVFSDTTFSHVLFLLTHLAKSNRLTALHLELQLIDYGMQISHVNSLVDILCRMIGLQELKLNNIFSRNQLLQLAGALQNLRKFTLDRESFDVCERAYINDIVEFVKEAKSVTRLSAKVSKPYHQIFYDKLALNRQLQENSKVLVVDFDYWYPDLGRSEKQWKYVKVAVKG